MILFFLTIIGIIIGLIALVVYFFVQMLIVVCAVIYGAFYVLVGILENIDEKDKPNKKIREQKAREEKEKKKIEAMERKVEAYYKKNGIPQHTEKIQEAKLAKKEELLLLESSTEQEYYKNPNEEKLSTLEKAIWGYAVKEIRVEDYKSQYTFVNAVDVQCYEKYVFDGVYTEKQFANAMNTIMDDLKNYYNETAVLQKSALK